MMSIYDKTKVTEWEKEIDQYVEGECRGAGMYCVLAYLAQEKGGIVSESFIS